MTDWEKQLKELERRALHLLHVVNETRDLVIDYYGILRTILKNTGIVIYDNRINKEDIGLINILELVTRKHQLYKTRGILHYRHDGIEFDFLLFGTTLRDWKRVVSVEMKATDFTKAVEQASVRMPYADYSYVAIDISPPELLRLFWNDLVYCKEHGIGVITLYPYPQILLRAKHNTPKYKLYDILEGVWKDKAQDQTKIIDFVKEAVEK